jgi:hypothetical protein
MDGCKTMDPKNVGTPSKRVACKIGLSIPGLGQVALAGRAAFFGFFGLTLTGLCAVTGVMRTGLRAILAGAATGSGERKYTRQPGLSSDLFLTMHAVTRSTSGTNSPQSDIASPVQACCCSGV